MELSIETLKKIEAEFGEFDISQVLGGSNDAYLRFGYWNQVNTGKLQEIIGTSIVIEEWKNDDDEGGSKYMYRIFDSMFYKK